MVTQPRRFAKITNRHDYGDVFYNTHGYRRGTGQEGVYVMPVNLSGGIPMPAPAPMPIPVLP